LLSRQFRIPLPGTGVTPLGILALGLDPSLLQLTTTHPVNLIRLILIDHCIDRLHLCVLEITVLVIAASAENHEHTTVPSDTRLTGKRNAPGNRLTLAGRVPRHEQGQLLVATEQMSVLVHRIG